MTESQDHRTMNRSMADRLDGMPATPLPEHGYALRVLRSTGRTSGEPRATPLGVLRLADELHLVSPDGGRDWVRNLRADPRCVLSAGGDSQTFSAAELRESLAASVVRGYLDVVEVPWALRAFPVEPTASVQEIESVMDTMAVFRLVPAGHV